MCIIYSSFLCIHYEEHYLTPIRCITNIVELMSFNFNREKGGEYTNDARVSKLNDVIINQTKQQIKGEKNLLLFQCIGAKRC